MFYVYLRLAKNTNVHFSNPRLLKGYVRGFVEKNGLSEKIQSVNISQPFTYSHGETKHTAHIMYCNVPLKLCQYKLM